MQIMNPFWLIIVSMILGLLPIALSLITSYVKVSVVLSMIRNALGLQQIPGTLVIMALSFAITIFIMGPVLEDSAARIKKLPLDKIIQEQPNAQTISAAEDIFLPWHDFMLKHTSNRELEALLSLDGENRPMVSHDQQQAMIKDPALRILVPAFMLSELRQAFSMGFLVLLPFLVIDLIVANVLAGMGMYMMSPVLVSLPLKLLVFVFSDAWLVIVRGLILSYR